MFATPLRLMLRPFRVYRELGDSQDDRSPVVGAARFLFVVGAFVALTATGRLSPVETLSGMFSFAWLPLAHAIGLRVALRAFARDAAFSRAYALFLESLGPWLLVFLVLSGSCLFTPQPARPVFTLLGPLIVIGAVWSAVLVFALFRAGLSLGRGRALGATALFFVVMHAVVLTYYFAAGQLWPIMPW